MDLEVLRGERMLGEIASENVVHPNMLTRWKTEADYFDFFSEICIDKS